MSDLLLEIGTEEIPAGFLTPAVFDLKRVAKTLLSEYSIEVLEENVHVYSTPRRLAVIVRGIPDRQEDRVKEAFGPPKKVAFAEDGTLTKAGLKFAESQGVSPDKLTVKKKDKGEYVVAVIEEKGRLVKDILPEILKKIILSLNFPKSMKWGDGTLKFVRPIRWITAVLGSEVIAFDIDGIKSSNKTFGHRFLSPKEIEVTADSYYKLLKENFVIAEHTERKAEIERQMEKLTKAVSATVSVDPGLLDTVTNLVEWPQAVMGSFEESYRKLPEELLNTVMKSHQKYFSLKGKDGKLLPNFIIIGNTKPENDETVRRGAERVIRARFEDARFYYEDDVKRPLIERLEELKRVTFYEGLGSLYDKTMRVVALSESIAKKVFSKEFDKEKHIENAKRAALLSKCDLVTGVVREFPELQGVMGKYYAQNNNEDFGTRALEEQYLFNEQDLSRMSNAGAVLSLADRMDTIASFFSIGQKPTGSQDPFALRRNALAVIWILINKNYDITIDQLIEASLPKKAGEQLRTEIAEFFRTRIAYLLSSQSFQILTGRTYSPDVIESALPLSTSTPVKDFLNRLGALQAFKSEPSYADFLTAIKRVRNIIPKAELPPYKAELFKDEAERKLGDSLEGVKQEITTLIGKSDYSGALKEALNLTGPINDFFVAVMVMDKDEAIKQNRLSLLSDIWKTVSQIADLSKLQEK